MGTHHKGTAQEVRALNALITLLRAADSVTAGLALRLSGRLTLSQFGVMEALLHLGPMHPCELARKLLKTGGNMTLVLDNLEKRGWVERVRDTVDRRYQVVHLTPAGKRNIAAMFPDHAREVAVRMSILDAEELETLRALCRKLGRFQDDPCLSLDPKIRRKRRK